MRVGNRVLQAFIESKGLPWTDIEGNPRDSPPDLGAYEYTIGGGGNNPPNQPSSPNPVNGATGRPVNLTMTWTCTEPDGRSIDL